MTHLRSTGGELTGTGGVRSDTGVTEGRTGGSAVTQNRRELIGLLDGLQKIAAIDGPVLI
jgi:hypothetical protein